MSYVLGLRVLELKLYCEWESHSDFDGEFQKRATAFESLLKKGAISIRNTKHFLTFIENIGTVFEMKHYIMQKRKEKQEILNNLLKKIRNPKSYVIERKWLIESIEGLL